MDASRLWLVVALLHVTGALGGLLLVVATVVFVRLVGPSRRWTRSVAP